MNVIYTDDNLVFMDGALRCERNFYFIPAVIFCGRLGVLWTQNAKQLIIRNLKKGGAAHTK